MNLGGRAPFARSRARHSDPRVPAANVRRPANADNLAFRPSEAVPPRGTDRHDASLVVTSSRSPGDLSAEAKSSSGRLPPYGTLPVLSLRMSEMADYEPRPPGTPDLPSPADLAIRMARSADAAAIASISAEREGHDAVTIQPRIEGELSLPEFGDRLGVWVATAGPDVLGFGRARWDDQAEGTGPRAVPAGWYLMGVVVRPAWRRRGVGRALLQARLAWVAERADRVYAVTSEHNRVSQTLLEGAGFVVVGRNVTHPRITFNKGVGLLLQLTCGVSASLHGCLDPHVPGGAR